MAKKIVRKKKKASNVIGHEEVLLLDKVLSEPATRIECIKRAKYGVTTKELAEIYLTYSKEKRYIKIIELLYGG